MYYKYFNDFFIQNLEFGVSKPNNHQKSFVWPFEKFRNNTGDSSEEMRPGFVHENRTHHHKDSGETFHHGWGNKTRLPFNFGFRQQQRRN